MYAPYQITDTSFSDTLNINIKLKTKHRIHSAAMLLFYILRRN